MKYVCDFGFFNLKIINVKSNNYTEEKGPRESLFSFPQKQCNHKHSVLF